jgi:hypothetical protein
MIQILNYNLDPPTIYNDGFIRFSFLTNRVFIEIAGLIYITYRLTDLDDSIILNDIYKKYTPIPKSLFDEKSKKKIEKLLKYHIFA